MVLNPTVKAAIVRGLESALLAYIRYTTYIKASACLKRRMRPCFWKIAVKTSDRPDCRLTRVTNLRP